jgi:hypothetical protein
MQTMMPDLVLARETAAFLEVSEGNLSTHQVDQMSFWGKIGQNVAEPISLKISTSETRCVD